MHQRRAQFLAFLCLAFTVASMGYLGYSYFETRKQVTLEDSRPTSLAQRTSEDAPAAPPAERYVAPAPILYPFY